MKYIITERQLKFLKEENNSGILKIPYIMVGNDWWELQNAINDMSDPPPPYILEGDVDLQGVDVVTLGSLVGVDGDFYLSNNEIIEDLGSLKFVEGLFFMQNTNIESLGNLKSVGGFLDLRNTNIKFLGNLETVGGNLHLSDSKIEDLGNLKSVEGHLDLTATSIESLGNLQSVGGYLDLSKTNIESLGNLQYVGGNLFLINTPLSKTTTKEEIRNMPNLTIEGNIYF